jgi:hypothetical protein
MRLLCDINLNVPAMKRIVALSVLLLLLFSTTLPAAEMMPAFPGAEGFGRYTTGGRGGTVYHVTSLADDGSEGTLRWALNKGGRRTVVFDVSGTVRLTSAMPIVSGNVTIAGQTAPGDGICVADYPFTINASNVIIRFMRFRLGNLHVADHEGDGLGGMDQQNIMVDHCSVSWSIDECCSVYGMKNMTLQWCLVAQSLRNAGHVKGAHGYGGNWGGSGASYHHNLMVHHDSRTPRLGPRVTTQTDERMDFRNNVIYNWGGNGCYGGEGMNVNMVNNFYKPGPGTKQRSAGIQCRIAGIGIRTTDYVTSYPAYAPMLHTWGKYFVNGNQINGNAEVSADNWTKGIYEQISNSTNDYLYTQATKDSIKLAAPIDYVYVTTQTPAVAYDKVLKYAGASLTRDWVDSLMVNDTRYGMASHTGAGAGNILGIIDSQEDNKPVNAPADWSAWPVLKSTACPTDTDRDGMPDAWESANGLNPTNASDGNLIDKDGYTMLEKYLNSLVDAIVTDQNAEGAASGSIVESSSNTSSKVTINSTLYNGAAGASSPWTFDGGYSITNGNSKTYATGSDNRLKYSNNVKFTVVLPTGIQVDTITFAGYDNYADVDSYISELNGSTFSSTTYVFPQKTASGTATVATHVIPFQTPVTNTFTFTLGGKQTVLTIVLSTKVYNALQTVRKSQKNPNTPIDVYGLDGRIVKRGIARNLAERNLEKGLYIVDGRKIAVME